ncbi:MAG: ADYC domain-containing protein [Nannocystaceae bacterium]
MTHTTTTLLGAAAAALLALSACDSADLVDDEAGLSFRADPWDTGRLNTFFLGQDHTYPINAVPIVDDPAADVRLHAVWTKRCFNEEIGAYYDGELFYTSNLDGELGITVTNGKLMPATFRKFGDPSTTCTVAGADWLWTVWGVITKDGEATKNHYMMILDAAVDENDNPVYEWGVYTGKDDIFVPKTYAKTCDEDKDPNADFSLRYHSYLFEGLQVDTDTGAFTANPDQFTVACRAGAIAKAASWGFTPWEYGFEVQELATRMVRADYCGDGTPHTEDGTLVQISDIYGQNAFGEPEGVDEAAWDLETGAAICVTAPRIGFQDPEVAEFSCGGVALPHCDQLDLSGAEMRTKNPV